VVDARPQGAVAAVLLQGYLHGDQRSLPVDREGNEHLEGLRRVHAGTAWGVLRARPLARAIIGAAATVADSHATVVAGGVQRGVPCELVGLHDINLRACNTADAVGIAVVVRALGGLSVLLHGDEVEGYVATTPRSNQVRSEAQTLSQQLQREVLAVVVRASGAGVRKVCPAAHVRYHVAAAQHIHRRAAIGRLPTRGHEGHHAMPTDIEPARALGACDAARRPQAAKPEGCHQERPRAWEAHHQPAPSDG